MVLCSLPATRSYLPTIDQLYIGTDAITFPLTPGTPYIIAHKLSNSSVWVAQNVTSGDSLSKATLDSLIPNEVYDLVIETDTGRCGPLTVTFTALRLGLPGNISLNNNNNNIKIYIHVALSSQ